MHRISPSQSWKEVEKRFEKLIGLDSKVLIEIPRGDLISSPDFTRWLWYDVELKWMRDFNNEKNYYPRWIFNQEAEIYGNFDGHYITSKFYRFDGTEESKMYGNNFNPVRGFLIRDHCDHKWDVVKVHMISDNLVRFLDKERIEHSKRTYPRQSQITD